MAGHQVFGPENIGKFARTGNSTAQLSKSRVNVGGLQFDTSNLILDLSLSGAGGIDSGSVQVGQYYYVYMINDSGEAKLVASLSSISPIGFSSFRKVGALNTSQLSTNIDQAITFGEQPISSIRLTGALSEGSTGIRTRVFDTVSEIKGLGISYVNSATDGDSFVINNDGNVNVSYSDFCNAVGGDVNGISLNADPSVGYAALPDGQRLGQDAGAQGAAQDWMCAAYSGFLAATSVVRAHVASGQMNDPADNAEFSISKNGTDEIDWTL